MKNIKRIIVKIPVLGYLMKLLSAIVLLPRHLTRHNNILKKHTEKISQLEITLLRANTQIIRNKDMIEKLKERK
jgi:hypothetical protein